MFNKKVIIILSLFFINGCKEDLNSNALIHKQLNDIYRADPLLDFQRDLKNNKLAFKGLHANGLLVPIISECLKKEYKINIIPGTSHMLQSYDQAKLQAIAQVYAEDYNSRMLSYIAEHKLSKCELARTERRELGH